MAAEGKVYRGAREEAGDIGHILINDDTLENLISWNRLREIVGTVGGQNDTLIVDEFYRQESKIRKRVENNSQILSLAIQNVFWIVDPHTIILSGFYELLGKEFLQLVKKNLAAYLSKKSFNSLDIVFSHNGFRSSLLGAGENVRDKWLNSL